MARKKKHPEHEEHVNHERWMVAYADILTLLLALFIVMFAMAAVDREKVKLFAQGAGEAFGMVTMPGQLGNFEGGDGIMANQMPAQPEQVPGSRQQERETALQEKIIPAPVEVPDKKPPIDNTAAAQREAARQAQAEAQKASLEKLKEELTIKLKEKGLLNSVEMVVDERGLVVNIVTDRVLFDTGRAELRPDGTDVLDLIAPVVKDLPNHVTVEGHTDNVPISGTFASNWELSTMRATTVLRRLQSQGVPGNRMNATGYADQRPLDSNRTDAGKARNRRVAIVVLPMVPLDGTGVQPNSQAAGSARPATAATTPASAPSPAAVPAAGGN
ncbi:chemotaxis protein MotB [Kineosphaera limosa]|uniref:Chemotaxis MotB protein n=1 Tax=Kineosphaera limosa NBRC 100340 TaxID=1184609 RepID=K6VNW4_9MICO|nr:flagellar motor protein MotB [Kineosphaera limosa]NYD99793.1 chemotaxis protein MotB [Kineosphaera limosa]GAB97893.1 chemotaxis MotB protein [Kineosphaera limosa NBRC 100340]